MLSRTGLHAVKALTALAGLAPDDYLGAATLAERIHAPRNYLGKLLQQLSRDGLVVSQKGQGGGFRLARAAESLTLYDVIDPIEHVARWSGCFLGGLTCSHEAPCAVHAAWEKTRAAYLDFLRSTRLSDLVHHPFPQSAGKH